MKYWKEVDEIEFNEATSRAKDSKTGKLYIVIEDGEIKDVIKDLLNGLKETELKTLKDFFDESECPDCGSVNHNDLREEAKKWLKSKELDAHEGDSHIKQWIKHFFNLEDEE